MPADGFGHIGLLYLDGGVRRWHPQGNQIVRQQPRWMISEMYFLSVTCVRKGWLCYLSIDSCKPNLTPKPTIARDFFLLSGVLQLLKATIKRSDFKQLDPAVATNVKYTDKKGSRRVHGGPGLKGTQAYPPLFGVRVAEALKKCPEPCVLVHKDVTANDDWADARLAECSLYFSAD